MQQQRVQKWQLYGHAILQAVCSWELPAGGNHCTAGTTAVSDRKDWRTTEGTLDGGPPMSHVGFKKWQCPLSLFLQFPGRFQNSLMSYVHVQGSCHIKNSFLMLISCMSHVVFKKWPCRPVGLKGGEPNGGGRPPTHHLSPGVRRKTDVQNHPHRRGTLIRSQHAAGGGEWGGAAKGRAARNAAFVSHWFTLNVSVIFAEVDFCGW